jgi:hypothetical protein
LNRTEAKGLTALILFALILYPFIWLYQTIGPIGFLLIAIGAVVAILISRSNSHKKAAEEFNELALYVLRNRLSPDEARRINTIAGGTDFAKGSLIRDLQILSDSLEIATTSTKRDTAESRMELAIETFSRISTEKFDLLEQATQKAVTRYFQDLKSLFHTNLYLNAAHSFLSKVDKLKTPKAKAKYLQLAKDTIQEGLGNVESDKLLLSNQMEELESVSRRITAD